MYGILQTTIHMTILGKICAHWRTSGFPLWRDTIRKVRDGVSWQLRRSYGGCDAAAGDCGGHRLRRRWESSCLGTLLGWSRSGPRVQPLVQSRSCAPQHRQSGPRSKSLCPRLTSSRLPCLKPRSTSTSTMTTTMKKTIRWLRCVCQRILCRKSRRRCHKVRHLQRRSSWRRSSPLPTTSLRCRTNPSGSGLRRSGTWSWPCARAPYAWNRIAAADWSALAVRRRRWRSAVPTAKPSPRTSDTGRCPTWRPAHDWQQPDSIPAPNSTVGVHLISRRHQCPATAGSPEARTILRAVYSVTVVRVSFAFIVYTGATRPCSVVRHIFWFYNLSFCALQH